MGLRLQLYLKCGFFASVSCKFCENSQEMCSEQKWTAVLIQLIILGIMQSFRSSQWCSVKKSSISQNSQENTWAGVFFFTKIVGWKHATWLKKRLQHRCFSVNFANFSRTPFLKNICEQLLLKFFKTATRFLL